MANCPTNIEIVFFSQINTPSNPEYLLNTVKVGMTVIYLHVANSCFYMQVYDSHSYFYSIQKIFEFEAKVLTIIFSFIRENDNGVSGDAASDESFSAPTPLRRFLIFLPIFFPFRRII